MEGALSDFRVCCGSVCRFVSWTTGRLFQQFDYFRQRRLINLDDLFRGKLVDDLRWKILEDKWGNYNRELHTCVVETTNFMQIFLKIQW